MSNHPARTLWLRRTFAVACLLAIVAGCSTESYLVLTPNLHTLKNAPDPFVNVPAALRTKEIQIAYATDRAAEPDVDGRRMFGFGRSMALEVGRVTVTMGDDQMDWDKLVAASRSAGREGNILTRVTEVKKLGSFPESNTPPVKVDGVLRESPEAVAQAAEAAAHIHERLRLYLNHVERKEVFLYVHGYNNTFDEAAIRMATLWHFMGRVGVPAIYSWPAGSSGLLRGYNRDRESGEFTVFHFKQFLRTLAACPEVEKIHIVAHSRGTDVTITALRELNLEYKHLPEGVRGRIKLGQLVLAAPDLDWEVFNQRVVAERMGNVPQRLTVYVSQGDKAISLADWLFQSGQRLGTLLGTDVKSDWQGVLKHLNEATIVDVTAKTTALGHSYFVDSPEVLSDLILVLRDARDPGPAHGRPLIQREDGFWELRDGYLKEPAPSKPAP